MVSIAGVWEHGWNVPIIEVNQWQMLLREFGIKEFLMTPISGVKSKWISLIEFENENDLLKYEKDKIKIFVDDRGEAELSTFLHPKNALYIFGRSGMDIFSHKKKEDLSLRINTPKNTALLFGVEACAIVLYDRFIKGETLWQ